MISDNKKEILVHIGIGKTGTSSIQTMLFENRDLLKDHSIYFPTKGLYQYAHHNIALYAKDDMPHHTKSLIKEIINDFELSNCQTMILSSEQFSYSRPLYVDTFASLLINYDVKIIFYVRRQVEYIYSSFLQKVKEGNEYFGSINEFYNVNRKGFDYLEIIKSWEKNFKKENILVRLYDKEFTPDVCKSFIEILSWNFLNKKYYTKLSENQSLLFDFVPIIKKLDDEKISTEIRNSIMTLLLGLSKKFKQLKHSNIEDKLYKKIKEDYYESNFIFSSRYLSVEERKKFLA